MGSLKIHPHSRVTGYTTAGAWTSDTIQGVFADRVRERGAHLAVADPADKTGLVDRLPMRLTWRELDAEVDAAAATLMASGIRAGDVVAVQLPNTVEQVVVFLAVWRLGAIVTPLSVSADAEQIVDACNEACVGAYVTATRVGADRVADRMLAVRSRIPTLQVVLAYGDGLPDGVVAMGGPSLHCHDEVAAYAATLAPAPDDCISICWTAGTGGRPKGVPHAHCESLALARSVVADARLEPGDVMLNPVPSSTATGITGTLLPWLVAGCVLVQHEPSDAAAFASRVADEKVTYTAARPSLLPELEARQPDLSTLTRIAIGAGPLSPETARRWQDRHGIELVDYFGTVEGVVLRSDPGAPLGQRTVLYPRTGYANGTEVVLVGLDGEGVIEVPGVPGELRVQGPTVFSGYLNPARDGDPFDADGLFATGEVFEIDGPEGAYLRYVGRLGHGGDG
ncbi:long-chain fatty acid--CoA ligase [Prescottella sp. R16]|uniref:long-chain fatty acid--CoA ligase n=1 Tax=Prescottella sp. R16 TaxID=3064529 RepID=UPI00272E168D|nr:long-chain fatty acid--CoA ligase [Prescottella sp. R16]